MGVYHGPKSLFKLCNSYEINIIAWRGVPGKLWSSSR